MDFDDPDDIQTDREDAKVIKVTDEGRYVTASQLLSLTPQAMSESLCAQLSEVNDICTLKAALGYAIHVSNLYDFRTIQRILGLAERCEETVPFNDEEDKRIAGGGA